MQSHKREHAMCARRPPYRTAFAQGKFQNQAGQQSCTDCTAGNYADTAGAVICKQCDAGRFATGTGASTCSACLPGTAAPATAAATCAECAKGSFAPASGLATCTLCGVGQVTNGHGYGCGVWGSSAPSACPAASVGVRACVRAACACEFYKEMVSQ